MIDITEVDKLLKMPPAQIVLYTDALCPREDRFKLDFTQLQLILACNFFARMGMADYTVLAHIRPWAQILVKDAQTVEKALDACEAGQPLQLFPTWVILYDDRYSGVLCGDRQSPHSGELYDSAQRKYVRFPHLAPGSCYKVCPLAIYLRTTAFPRHFNHMRAHQIATTARLLVQPSEEEQDNEESITASTGTEVQ